MDAHRSACPREAAASAGAAASAAAARSSPAGASAAKRSGCRVACAAPAAHGKEQGEGGQSGGLGAAQGLDKVEAGRRAQQHEGAPTASTAGCALLPHHQRKHLALQQLKHARGAGAAAEASLADSGALGRDGVEAGGGDQPQLVALHPGLWDGKK